MMTGDRFLVLFAEGKEQSVFKTGRPERIIQLPCQES